MCGSQGKTPQTFGVIVFWVCVSVSVFFCALVGVCVQGSWGIWAVVHSRWEVRRRCPAVAFAGRVRRVRFGGFICRFVLVRAVVVERSWQGGWFLLKKDALSFLHPWVVLHQLRVQEGILWDAVLYPFHQALWKDGERQRHFSNSRGSLSPQSIRYPLFLFSIQGKKERENEWQEARSYYILQLIFSF